jgi:hypothetical protein
MLVRFSQVSRQYVLALFSGVAAWGVTLRLVIRPLLGQVLRPVRFSAPSGLGVVNFAVKVFVIYMSFWAVLRVWGHLLRAMGHLSETESNRFPYPQISR